MRNLNFKSNDTQVYTLSGKQNYFSRAQVFTLSGDKIIFPELKFSLSLSGNKIFSRPKFSLSRETNFFPEQSFHSLREKFFSRRECGEFKSRKPRELILLVITTLKTSQGAPWGPPILFSFSRLPLKGASSGLPKRVMPLG